MSLQRYTLVTYINRCDCGHEQRYDILMALYRRSYNAFYSVEVKPGATLYKVNNGIIETELRTSHTRACCACVNNLEFQPYIETPIEAAVGLYKKPTPKKSSISIDDLEDLL